MVSADMTLPSKTWVWLVLLAIYLPTHSSWGQTSHVLPPHELLPANATTCAFAGGNAEFSYVGATEPVGWTLSAANRTIRQGQTGPIAGPADAAKLAISLDVPNLRPGVTLLAELRLTWNVAGKQLQHTQPVTIYSPDPFSVRRAALEEAHISLFDPVGDTAAILDQHDIPHAIVSNLSAIDRVDEGVVIIGEGASFREQQNLFPALNRASERGVSVLCLAPADGEFEFFKPSTANSGPLRIAFEQSNVVRRYDKRFDLLPTLSHLAVEPRRNTVVIHISEGGLGWSWFSADYAPHPQNPGAHHARLIVCGVSVIHDWEKTPVPRYLLVHLLEELAAIQTAEEMKHADVTQH
jgi:hypothetical protein